MSASNSEVASFTAPTTAARLAHIAYTLDQAAQLARPVPQIADPINLSDAYAVQRASVDLRLARGERMVGIKMGFTSKAKMQQMGVSDVIWGRLTDAMWIKENASVQLGRFVHPRVEPEVVFRLRKPLSGMVSAAEALDAVDAIAPGLEVIDSRFQAFKFSLTDVVADNASSSAFVVGGWRAPDIDLGNLEMTLAFDGRVLATGSTAAILDHPLKSLVAAARLAGEHGLRLEAGWIVLAGGATAAVALSPGVRVSLVVEALGRTGFSTDP